MSALADDLGRPGIKLLLILHKTGRAMHIRELQRYGISPVSTYRALSTCLQYGLVRTYTKHGLRYIELTEKGREVAELLQRAEELIKSSTQQLTEHEGTGNEPEDKF
ncbi:MAG: hypothetical protein DRJ40_07270 [Thermoprotei archaeon]|nr:MAG: hypothetical protein DRJ40_07270 [Thermoprotei archaeon]